MAGAEPDVDGSDVDGGHVADGEFVVSGGYGTVLFELVDAAFDSVTLLVGLGIEPWWPTASGSSSTPVGELVGGNGNRGFDATPP